MIAAAWSGPRRRQQRAGARRVLEPGTPRPCRRRARRPRSPGRRSCAPAAGPERSPRSPNWRSRSTSDVRCPRRRARRARFAAVSVLPVPPFGRGRRSARRRLRRAARRRRLRRATAFWSAKNVSPRAPVDSPEQTMSSAPDSKTWRTRPLARPDARDDDRRGRGARATASAISRSGLRCPWTRSGARRRRRAPRRPSSPRPRGCRGPGCRGRRAAGRRSQVELGVERDRGADQAGHQGVSPPARWGLRLRRLESAVPAGSTERRRAALVPSSSRRPAAGARTRPSRCRRRRRARRPAGRSSAG